MATPKLSTFLMFCGQAEEAMNFYIGLFPDSKVLSIKRYGKNEGGPEGTVMVAEFSLSGHAMKCIDSPVKHAFGFTPAVSIFVDCESGSEVERLFKSLSEGGALMMPLGEYPFAKKFAWLADRFGVSWQLSFK